MKKLITITVVALLLQCTVNAQKVTSFKWYQYYVGGKNGFFTKTHSFTNTTMIDNETGRGDKWDNKPVTIKVVDIYEENGMEKVITEYGDSSYYVVTFKNFTPNDASVCLSTTLYKTIEEAKTSAEPTEEEYGKWYTEAGYKASLKKPAMPEMKKQDVIKFTQFTAKMVKDIKAKMDNLSEEKKKESAFAFALLMSLAPTNYAEAKGFHPYKSMAVIERGVKKFKNDKDVKKIIASMDFKTK